MMFFPVRSIWRHVFSFVLKHKVISAAIVFVYILLNILLPAIVTPVLADSETGQAVLSASSNQEYIPTANQSTTNGPALKQNASSAPSEPVQQCQKAGLVRPGAANLVSSGMNETTQPPVYYRVYGTTVDQIKSQLKSCAPGQHFALTSYYMNWFYDVKLNSSGNCMINQVKVGINTVSQYPSWQNNGKASKATENAWNRLMANLTTHEQGHAAKSIAVARELNASLLGIPAQSCDQIKNSIKLITDNYVQKLARVNSDYDHATDHGRTEGAVL